MASCEICWTVPQPQKKHSYLVTLIDSVTAKTGQIVMQTTCTHDAQEWVEGLAATGSLVITDDSGESWNMDHPTIVNIDAKAAAHIPLVDPVN